jgi:A/G-specific adenine glycosylase
MINSDLVEFKRRIWDYYYANKRSFPWRETSDPYHILVSELMLQQTQTDRVVPKYLAFIERFPTIKSLSSASLADVLGMWQGLGYNRRALYLKKLAEIVQNTRSGVIPESIEELDSLPGIGYATACAISTYSSNRPTVFIETNVRSVFIHFFFQDCEGIMDSEIEPLVATTVDPVNPREWYYALMDYGVMLKKTIPNPNRKSAHYSKQSSFNGSDRKIRGEIIRILLDRPTVTREGLYDSTGTDPDRLLKIIDGMVKDGLLNSTDDIYSIADKK